MRQELTLKIVQQWMLEKRWWLIGLTVVVTFGVQIAEILIHSFNFFHAVEIVLYIGIIYFAGLLLDLQLKSANAQTRILKILDIKHKLSRLLADADDWEELADELTIFPGSVANIQYTCLFVRNPISNQFEPASYYPKNSGTGVKGDHDEIWEEWNTQIDDTCLNFGRCPSLVSESSLPTNFTDYCLPIKSGDKLLALMRFRLETGQNLSADQIDMFTNVGDEMAVAIKAGQDRKSFNEMRTSETALAERRTVSHYLHDNLSQNLGYLRLKLDQLAGEKDKISIDQIEIDLEHMRSAANESYEIVRGTLETLQPETTPHLTNLLQEHARKVGERANFHVRFETRGRPVPLKDDVQSAIFYACHEILSNVEKHSKASEVSILADWRGRNFDISISDNGVGFNPKNVKRDQHFGLEIVNERINNVNGRITLKTSENSGTVMLISVPIRISG